jgi:hypothetical protein
MPRGGKIAGSERAQYHRINPSSLAPAISSALRRAFVNGLSLDPKCSLKRPVLCKKVSKCLIAAGLLSKKETEVALRLSFN